MQEESPPKNNEASASEITEEQTVPSTNDTNPEEEKEELVEDFMAKPSKPKAVAFDSGLDDQAIKE